MWNLSKLIAITNHCKLGWLIVPIVMISRPLSAWLKMGCVLENKYICGDMMKKINGEHPWGEWSCRGRIFLRRCLQFVIVWCSRLACHVIDLNMRRRVKVKERRQKRSLNLPMDCLYYLSRRSWRELCIHVWLPRAMTSLIKCFDWCKNSVRGHIIIAQ